MAEIPGQPAVAFAQQSGTAEPVSVDTPEDAIESDRPPTTHLASALTTDAETGGDPANTDSMVILPPPKVPSKAGRHLLDPPPAPRKTVLLSATVVNRNPALPPSEPTREQRQVLPAEQPDINQAEREHLNRERIERQDEEDRLSRELAAQKRELAEIARQEQLVRRQAQQAVIDQSERERVAAEKSRQEQEAQEKLQKERRIQEEQERLTAERARQVQRVREQEQLALREQAERKHAAAEKSQQERKLQEEMGRRKRMAQTLEQPKREPVAAATKRQEIAASGAPEKRTEKRPTQQPQKGLAIPPLKGDLKLVVSGATLPKITVTFKDFALSRRDRPFSRVEARRETIITPLIAHTQEKIREVVIEKARPGVYTVTVEPVSGSSDFTCLLKLHEGASDMSVREFGRHTLQQKKVLLKILMPDGIIWDDSSVFSGSMEDSDSVTKFNTGTGLMWKEYSD